MRHFKQEDSTPEFCDFKVTIPEAWEECKSRMLNNAENRINWDYLKKNYPLWQKEGHWIEADFWFGFDVTHSWMMGTENHLIAMYEEPEGRRLASWLKNRSLRRENIFRNSP